MVSSGSPDARHSHGHLVMGIDLQTLRKRQLFSEVFFWLRKKPSLPRQTTAPGPARCFVSEEMKQAWQRRCCKGSVWLRPWEVNVMPFDPCCYKRQ